MPRRKHKQRSRRMNDQTIHRLREVILSGFPWLAINRHEQPKLGDDEWRLLAAVTGQYCTAMYFLRDPWGAADEEKELLQGAAWEALKDDVLAQHVRYRPGTRPRPWWDIEAPETRRVLGVDRDEDDEGNGHGDDRLPAFEDPNLPEHAKQNYFGRPNCYDGFCYESQRAYLERLNLLTDYEKEIFAKYDAVALRVHVAPGMFGKCEECWQEAREIAKEIDFDLDAAVQAGHEMPWLPDDLVFICGHIPDYMGEHSIFEAR